MTPSRVERGEFVSIIGHSGHRKSPLLTIVAGLTAMGTGAVIGDHMAVDESGPDGAVVFQSHSLPTSLSVYQNVRLALGKVFAHTKSRAGHSAWTLHNLCLTPLAHALAKRPAELFGGRRQRVGIARALAMEPKDLLLDEPFGALDTLTRADLRASVMEPHAKLGDTAPVITHDVDLAVLLLDRIVMMTNGLARPRDRLRAMVDRPTARSRGDYGFPLRPPRPVAGGDPTPIRRPWTRAIPVRPF
jgi:nitrate/nitrite transport system ATP-binding protein